MASSKLYYKHEFVDRLKSVLSDAIHEELNAFADDNGEAANIALRNRIAGMYDLICLVEKQMNEEDD